MTTAFFSFFKATSTPWHTIKRRHHLRVKFHAGKKRTYNLINASSFKRRSPLKTHGRHFFGRTLGPDRNLPSRFSSSPVPLPAAIQEATGRIWQMANLRQTLIRRPLILARDQFQTKSKSTGTSELLFFVKDLLGGNKISDTTRRILKQIEEVTTPELIPLIEPRGELLIEETDLLVVIFVALRGENLNPYDERAGNLLREPEETLHKHQFSEAHITLSEDNLNMITGPLILSFIKTLLLTKVCQGRIIQEIKNLDPSHPLADQIAAHEDVFSAHLRDQPKLTHLYQAYYTLRALDFAGLTLVVRHVGHSGYSPHTLEDISNFRDAIENRVLGRLMNYLDLAD